MYNTITHRQAVCNGVSFQLELQRTLLGSVPSATILLTVSMSPRSQASKSLSLWSVILIMKTPNYDRKWTMHFEVNLCDMTTLFHR